MHIVFIGNDCDTPFELGDIYVSVIIFLTHITVYSKKSHAFLIHKRKLEEIHEETFDALSREANIQANYLLHW